MVACDSEAVRICVVPFLALKLSQRFSILVVIAFLLQLFVRL